jgi:hypothetical protein
MLSAANTKTIEECKTWVRGHAYDHENYFSDQIGTKDSLHEFRHALRLQV